MQPNNAQVQNLLQQLKAWQLRQLEQIWATISKRQTVEDFREYLQTYPDCPHADEARRALPSLLRKKLLASPSDRMLRNEYLDQRVPALADDDAEMALRGSRIAYAVATAIAGAIAGAFIGGITWLGALPAGVVAGVAVAVFLDRPGFKGQGQPTDERTVSGVIVAVVVIGFGMVLWLLAHYSDVASGGEAFFGFLLGALAAPAPGPLRPSSAGAIGPKRE